MTTVISLKKRRSTRSLVRKAHLAKSSRNLRVCSNYMIPCIGSKKLKNKKEGYSRFIENEADEASDYEESDDDEEREINHEQQYYKPGELYKRTDQRKVIENIEKVALEQQKEGGMESLSEMEDEGEIDEDDKANLQPSTKDPRLWQVRVKRGLEK
jgi:hypothetical protein